MPFCPHSILSSLEEMDQITSFACQAMETAGFAKEWWPLPPLSPPLHKGTTIGWLDRSCRFITMQPKLHSY